jgi:hypothetical protein
MAAHNRMLELSLIWTDSNHQDDGISCQKQSKADATQITEQQQLICMYHLLLQSSQFDALR